MRLSTHQYCEQIKATGKVGAPSWSCTCEGHAATEFALHRRPTEIHAMHKLLPCFPTTSPEQKAVTARSFRFQLLASSPIYHSVHLSVLIAF